MNLTPSQLAIGALILLALAFFAIAGMLLVADQQRSQRSKVLGRALSRDTDVSLGSKNAPNEIPQPGIELPFHWLSTSIGRAFVADEDRQLIDQCGFPSMRAQLVFLVTRIALAVLFPILAFSLWAEKHSTQTNTIVISATIVIGFMAPKWILSRLAARRRDLVAEELPLFIDLLRLLQGVGLSLDQSLQIMAADFSHVLRVLGYELTLANRQYSQGRTREHSLSRLATLHKNENLNGMVSLLVQVDRHGGAVQEPLRVFSDRLREHRKSEMKERIGKITVKMTGVMVATLLPALVIITAGPGFIAISRSLGAIAK